MKETGKQKTGDAESPGSEFEYVTERSDGYNFTHVIASTTIASLFRGVHTRMTLSRWKRMVGFAKADPKVHPLTRTRNRIKEQNFLLLTTGVNSIAQRSTLSKIANRARLKVIEEVKQGNKET